MSNLGLISEWRSADFGTLTPFELALLAAIYISLARGVRVSMIRLLVLLGLLHLGLHHARHQLLFGIVGSLIFAEPLGRALSAGRSVVPKPATGWSFAPGAVILAAMVALTLVRFTNPATGPDAARFPGEALAHVPPDLAATPVLNDYSFGAYLIFRSVPPFIDSRADLYGDAFLSEYRELMQPDRPRLAEAIARRGIKWMILAAGSPVADAMEATPGWRRIYSDKIAAVFSRDEAH